MSTQVELPHDKYAPVKDAIKSILKRPGYDDDSIAPVLPNGCPVGGSNGATMRFPLEAGDPANAGLEVAREALEVIKKKFEWVSYADLWTLAGVVGIEAMGGPTIPWQPGRKDVPPTEHNIATACPANGLLPDAAQGVAHILELFCERMGFTIRECTALVGAHSVGRCHSDRSGYEGAWTYTPTRFSNQFYKLLLNQDWKETASPKGLKQYTNAPDNDLMMLPADMALLEPPFREFTELYAKDKQAFFKDFASAYGKLLELGLHEYQVVGRKLPSEQEPVPKLYRMRLFAPNEVVAKSRFWYFLKKLRKVKKAAGEIVSINEIFEKRPQQIKNFGIWLRYDSRSGTHNMYKEYRELSRTDAVESCYQDMAARHRARFSSVQIIRVAEVANADVRRPYIRQLLVKNIAFPLPHRVHKAPKNRRALFLAKRPTTFY
ncbi:hypothetical protein BZG36_03504 [Bifiguratus adelaidae]|uniref:Peroxidase n=1 Tax=Bifiguratus adelaidae TaxID=1938954 RepID=A0A261XZ89_9FUNG|nr:hypothetical protein BZG36_03504 [Bifiguratus adelaidae]